MEEGGILEIQKYRESNNDAWIGVLNEALENLKEKKEKGARAQRRPKTRQIARAVQYTILMGS